MDAPVMPGGLSGSLIILRLKSVISTPVTGAEKVTVKLTLVALVGLEPARLMEVMVGLDETTTSDSNAPISQLVPFGRVAPRWSRLLTGRAEHTVGFPASIAGDPDSRGKTCV